MTCVALSILSSPTFFRQWPIKLALMGCFYYGSPACKHMCPNLNHEFIEFDVIAMLIYTDIFNSIRSLDRCRCVRIANQKKPSDLIQIDNNTFQYFMFSFFESIAFLYMIFFCIGQSK